MASLQQILLGILEMAGKDRIYAECGADYPVVYEGKACNDGDGNCPHINDCRRQAAKVEQTRKLREQIENLALQKDGGRII